MEFVLLVIIVHRVALLQNHVTQAFTSHHCKRLMLVTVYLVIVENTVLKEIRQSQRETAVLAGIALKDLMSHNQGTLYSVAVEILMRTLL
jgi:hypothetical protein